MGEIFRKKPLRRTLKSVYEDVNEAFDQVTEGNVTDGSITNTKLATDIKIGSLASLTTDVKTSVQAAINEVDSNADAAQSAADAKYTKPEGGIPKTDLATDVQASLDKAESAMQGSTDINAVRGAKVQLNGANPSPVAFQDDTAATILGTVASETFDLTGVGNGGTVIVNPDGDGADTATINFAAGNSVSGATPSTDITGEVDTKFKISVDGDEAEEVTLDNSGKNSGALIAAEMQTKIQALGGNKAGVTVTYNDIVAGKYAIVSGTLGTGSSVVITPSDSGSITEELKIGVTDGGVETAGTGDVANAAAATLQEIIDVINADIGLITASIDSTKIRFTSNTVGKDSSLVIGSGTLNAVLGFTETDAAYGAQGLGYDSDMSDGNYIIAATIEGVASALLADLGLSITNKAASGFDIECETAASEAYVNLIIIGQSA